MGIARLHKYEKLKGTNQLLWRMNQKLNNGKNYRHRYNKVWYLEINLWSPPSANLSTPHKSLCLVRYNKEIFLFSFWGLLFTQLGKFLLHMLVLSRCWQLLYCCHFFIVIDYTIEREEKWTSIYGIVWWYHEKVSLRATVKLSRVTYRYRSLVLAGIIHWCL